MFVSLQFTHPAGAADDLVVVNVTVIGEYGRPIVASLKKEDFQVLEDKKPQQIDSFSIADSPISLGTIFDTSGSMEGDRGDGRLEIARQAVIEFLRGSDLKDEVFMVTFGEHPEVVLEPTILNQIKDLPHPRGKGRTALLDAVHLGIEKMAETHNQRKVLLIVSDGGENASHHNKAQIKEQLGASDVQIDALCIFKPTPPVPEELEGPKLLSELSDLTAGLTFVAETTDSLFEVAKNLAEDVRRQWAIGYRSTNTIRDGGWRKIQVKLVRTKETTGKYPHARAGYYAPRGQERVPVNIGNASR